MSRWFPALQALRGFYRASPGTMVAQVAVCTVSGVLMPAFMLATGAMVQAVQTGGSLTLPLVALGLIFAGHRTMNPLVEEIGNALGRRVDESLDQRIMVALSAPVGLAHIEDPEVQNRLAQMRGAVSGISAGTAAQQFSIIWTQRIQGIASLIIVGRYYWWAAIPLGVVYVLAYSAGRWHFKQVTELMYGRTDEMRRSYYVRGLALSSSMAKEARVFDLAGWLVERYRSSALAVMTEVWRKRQEGWLVAAGMLTGLALLEIAVLWLVAADALTGRQPLAVTVAVAQAVLGAGLLSVFLDFDWAMIEASNAMSRVAELERAVEYARPVEGGRLPADHMPLRGIRLEGVRFAYPGRNTAVFDGLDLKIEAGRSLAIVGENGAGKTTFVKLLARLYDPDAGRILVDGTDLRELDPASWRRRLAAVFQDFARFELSAYDNVALGALHAREDQAGVEQAAAKAGALGLLEGLSSGWQTILSREYSGGTQLSGGEWQRLALARALFAVDGGAGVLVLDEPTASLDVRAEAEVYERFLELTRGLTTIVISHRFSTVRQADRIVVIEHGRLVEDGRHETLMAAGGRYAEMYALQAARFEDESVDA